MVWPSHLYKETLTNGKVWVKWQAPTKVWGPQNSDLGKGGSQVGPHILGMCPIGGFTHIKALGEHYHEPKHLEGECFYAYFIRVRGGEFMPTNRHNFPPVLFSWIPFMTLCLPNTLRNFDKISWSPSCDIQYANDNRNPNNNHTIISWN